MAYSAFIWITSKTKLGKTEAGISQFSFYPPVFKNANIWHREVQKKLASRMFSGRCGSLSIALLD